MVSTVDVAQIVDALSPRVRKKYQEARDWITHASAEERLEWIEEDFPQVLERLDRELGSDSEEQMALLFNCLLNRREYTWQEIGDAYGFKPENARRRFLRTATKLFDCIGEFHARSKATLWRLSKTEMGCQVLSALLEEHGKFDVSVFLRGLALRNKRGCYVRLRDEMRLQDEVQARRIMRRMCKAFRRKYVDFELKLEGRNK